MYYVAVDIGCIECGEPTHIIGVFTKRAKAVKTLSDHEKRQKSDWHGQHAFEIYNVSSLDTIRPIDYTTYPPRQKRSKP